MRICEEYFGLALGFFVSIPESLSDIDFILERDVSFAGNIRRADVMEASCGCPFGNRQNISCPTKVHAEDLIAIFLGKRQRGGAMPNLTGGPKNPLKDVVAEAQIWVTDIAFVYLKQMRIDGADRF
jgi:hypothetical protein